VICTVLPRRKTSAKKVLKYEAGHSAGFFYAKNKRHTKK
jgi:hypothetical protein